MEHSILRACSAVLLTAGCQLDNGHESSAGKITRTRSNDGVEIAYTTSGSGLPALVFVHGGLAHSGFWRHALAAFSARHVVVALDLAGHGSSGGDREVWTIPRFAEDVQAVADELGLSDMVLVGNSLGGAVALEAAARMPGRVRGVVGVDTFHDLLRRPDPDAVRSRARAFEQDPGAAARAMAAELFHPGPHLELQAWVERAMSATPSRTATWQPWASRSQASSRGLASNASAFSSGRGSLPRRCSSRCVPRTCTGTRGRGPNRVSSGGARLPSLPSRSTRPRCSICA
jgi:pimeloyl-ACP methyl ester carboxylesterase